MKICIKGCDMEMKLKLKNCPFCGGDDIHVEKWEKGSRICCYDCLIGFWQCEATCEEDQVKAWNNRADSDQIEKIVKENQDMFAENMKLCKELERERSYNSALITLIKAGTWK